MTSSPWKYFFLHNLGRSFHIWWQIEAALNGLNFPKWLPDWCQNNFWTSKHIQIMSGSWKMHNTKGYILSFWSTFYLKNWRSFDNFKIWPIFLPDDVINDVINTKNYTDLARYKIHIPVKFGVDCSNGATCIVNITDKQTDKQTDRQTVRRTYLPKLKILASKKAINNSYIYIHISCKCDTNRAGHFTLDAHASRPVACTLSLWQQTVLKLQAIK